MKITVPCAHYSDHDTVCGEPVALDVAGGSVRCPACRGELLLAVDADGDVAVTLGEFPEEPEYRPGPDDPEILLCNDLSTLAGEVTEAELIAHCRRRTPVYELDVEAGRMVDQDRPGEDVTSEAAAALGWEAGDRFSVPAPDAWTGLRFTAIQPEHERGPLAFPGDPADIEPEQRHVFEVQVDGSLRRVGS